MTISELISFLIKQSDIANGAWCVSHQVDKISKCFNIYHFVISKGVICIEFDANISEDWKCKIQYIVICISGRMPEALYEEALKISHVLVDLQKELNNDIHGQ